MRNFTRISLDGFKSFRSCRVELQELNFLVGPNGSGKSNFLDAFAFVAEALDTSLEHAVRERGGIHELCHRGAAKPPSFQLRFEVDAIDGSVGHYSIGLRAVNGSGFEVAHEDCKFDNRQGSGLSQFRVEHGRVVIPPWDNPPPARVDRLYLPSVVGNEHLNILFQTLTRVRTVNPSPTVLARPQAPGPGGHLFEDCRNAGAVLGAIPGSERADLIEWLGQVQPGLKDVRREIAGGHDILTFDVLGVDGKVQQFPAAGMSDGTLRALGLLLALAQDRIEPMTLLGLEEPETALHPGVLPLFFDLFRRASRSTQLLVTTHSPELLDRQEVSTESLLVVESVNGATEIGPLDEAGRSVMRDRLFTPGELLRLNQMRRDRNRMETAVSGSAPAGDLERR